LQFSNFFEILSRSNVERACIVNTDPFFIYLNFIYLPLVALALPLEFELLLDVPLFEDEGLAERTVELLLLGDGLLALCTLTELAGLDCLCWLFTAGR